MNLRGGQIQYEVRLFGPMRGQTVNINGHRFVDGVCRMTGKPEALAHALIYLSKYQAYAKGFDEYDRALMREVKAERKAQEDDDGLRDPSQTRPVGNKAAQVRGDGGQDVRRASSATADDGAGDDDDDGGDAGFRSGGDRHGHAGFSNESHPAAPNAALKVAVTSLDPNDDSVWTKMGAPAVAALAEILGDPSITRAAIEAAAPGWDRDKARLAKSL